MRLLKLELFGFKSFADRTLVEFDQGVTCIVGPNGCGKSNISDSIRWVLGERSAKLLRGTRMEDVIFAGTAVRKPLAMAEVSLTIDNSDRGLPIDYNEVTISRRLYRSGESEYLINKTICRLKDVQDLILDTGIGSNSYSMIEQGRIDYILNADADERRFLIEEAAGISKYKVKREEAVRKLGRTEENLLRLRDIIKEVQRNIQYAERQARRAERYKTQLEKLKNLEIKKAFFELKELENHNSRLEGEQSRRRTDIEALEVKLRECRDHFGREQETLKGILERFSAEELNRYDLKSKIEHNEHELKYHQEKRVEFAKRRGEIGQEKNQIHERIEKASGEIAEKARELGEFETEKSSAQSDLEKAGIELAETEVRLTSAKEGLEGFRERSTQAATELDKARSEYHRLTAILETNKEQKQRQEAGAERYQKEMEQWKARRGTYEGKIHEIEATMARLGGELQATRAVYEKDGVKIEALEEAVRACEEKVNEKQARLGVLEEIDQSLAIDPKDLVSQDNTDDGERLLKNLRDIMDVEQGFEWALEAAFGDYARSLVADELSTAVSLMRKLDKSKTIPFSVLIKGAYPSSSDVREQETPMHPAIQCALKDVVKFHEGYEGTLKSFVQNVFVVESLDETNFEELWRLSRDYKFVTRSGTFLGTGGKVFFREGQVADEESSFKRGVEIEALREELRNLKQDIEVKRSELSAAKAAKEKSADSLKRLEEELLDGRLQKESFESNLAGTHDRLGSYQQELDLIFTESMETETREQDTVKRRIELEDELKRLEDIGSELKLQRELISKELEEIERLRQTAVTKVAECRAKMDSLEEKDRLLRDTHQRMVQHDELDKERLTVLGQEQERIEQREVELEEEDRRIHEEQSGLTGKARQCDLQLELIRQEKEKVDQEIAMLEESLRQIQENLQALQDELHREEMKGMDLGYKQKAVHDRLQQSYRIQLEELNPEEFVWAEEDARTSEEELVNLRRKVESLGTVNLLAIEEYEELKERYDFLLSQQQDMEDARSSLMEAIRKINRTTKQLFEETFQQAQRTFKEYYEILFGGGEGRLVLLDEVNPLDSGIDIVVRPPGKKLQHISLLSGGEKALTALALLFSLFRIKPSPFCVLDEVDAPLDEANIDRFLSVLKSFLETSQFIIVTHNRKTITMGDSLYGVTMEEAGVSKIVSVKINDEPESDSPKEQRDQVTA